MQMEIDILKETIDVLKKDQGINKTPLSNGEKAVIADALKTKYPLLLLLKKLIMAKRSAYALQKNTKMIVKLLHPYSAIIKKDTGTVESKLF